MCCFRRAKGGTPGIKLNKRMYQLTEKYEDINK